MAEQTEVPEKEKKTRICNSSSAYPRTPHPHAFLRGPVFCLIKSQALIRKVTVGNARWCLDNAWHIVHAQ